MAQLTREAAITLRSTGGRMTTQRRLILETLESLGGHPTADEVYAVVGGANPAESVHDLPDAGVAGEPRAW